MRQFRLIRVATLGVLLSPLPGCYSYIDLPSSGPQVGQRVRVRVSGAEAERLEAVLGQTGRAIEGDVLDRGDSSIALAVALQAPTEASGLAQQATQRIDIPRSDLQEIQLRRLDKLRTSILVGAGVAGIVAVAVGKGSTLLGNRGPGGSPNEHRVPPSNFVLGWSITVP